MGCMCLLSRNSVANILVPLYSFCRNAVSVGHFVFSALAKSFALQNCSKQISSFINSVCFMFLLKYVFGLDGFILWTRLVGYFRSVFVRQNNRNLACLLLCISFLHLLCPFEAWWICLKCIRKRCCTKGFRLSFCGYSSYFLFHLWYSEKNKFELFAKVSHGW